MDTSKVKENIKNRLNRIGMVNGMVRPILEHALKQSVVYSPFKELYTSNNMLELWMNSSGDKFFDMGTFIRLGSEVEGCFSEYYMFSKGHKNLLDLKTDKAVTGGVFQRVLTGSNTLQDLYRDELGIELEMLPEFKEVQKFFVHRHLYTHRSGLVDDKYLENHKLFCGVDLLLDSEFQKMNYPNEDVYWFRPLKDMWHYQDAVLKVFTKMP